MTLSRLTFTVPGKPVGVNNSHRGGSANPFGKTRELGEYQDLVATHGLIARRRARLVTREGDVGIALRVFFADERPDLDGPLKPTLDALQVSDARTGRLGAGILKNDRQVRQVLLLRGLDRAKPRVEVTVSEPNDFWAMLLEETLGIEPGEGTPDLLRALLMFTSVDEKRRCLEALAELEAPGAGRAG